MNENFASFIVLCVVAFIVWIAYHEGHDRGYEEGRARADMIFERGYYVGRDESSGDTCRNILRWAESYEDHAEDKPTTAAVLRPFVAQVVKGECP